MNVRLCLAIVAVFYCVSLMGCDKQSPKKSPAETTLVSEIDTIKQIATHLATVQDEGTAIKAAEKIKPLLEDLKKFKDSKKNFSLSAAEKKELTSKHGNDLQSAIQAVQKEGPRIKAKDEKAMKVIIVT